MYRAFAPTAATLTRLSRRAPLGSLTVPTGGGPNQTSWTLPAPPWQFLVRAIVVVTGLALLLIVDVRGAAFYVAWTLIGLALISEGAATLAHWRRSRRGRA
jgi:hypothetical protein